jgi:heme-degrading monooxygenase HmoA
VVTAILTFELGDRFDRAKVEDVAQHSAPMFEGVPGLRSKVFTVDEQGRRAVNVYLWDDAETARAFYGPELVERATAAYGVAPKIEFFDVAASVANY